MMPQPYSGKQVCLNVMVDVAGAIAEASEGDTELEHFDLLRPSGVGARFGAAAAASHCGNQQSDDGLLAEGEPLDLVAAGAGLQNIPADGFTVSIAASPRTGGPPTIPEAPAQRLHDTAEAGGASRKPNGSLGCVG